MTGLLSGMIVCLKSALLVCSLLGGVLPKHINNYKSVRSQGTLKWFYCCLTVLKYIKVCQFIKDLGDYLLVSSK